MVSVLTDGLNRRRNTNTNNMKTEDQRVQPLQISNQFLNRFDENTIPQNSSKTQKCSVSIRPLHCRRPCHSFITVTSLGHRKFLLTILQPRFSSVLSITAKSAQSYVHNRFLIFVSIDYYHPREVLLGQHAMTMTGLMPQFS